MLIERRGTRGRSLLPLLATLALSACASPGAGDVSTTALSTTGTPSLVARSEHGARLEERDPSRSARGGVDETSAAPSLPLDGEAPQSLASGRSTTGTERSAPGAADVNGGRLDASGAGSSGSALVTGADSRDADVVGRGAGEDSARGGSGGRAADAAAEVRADGVTAQRIAPPAPPPRDDRKLPSGAVDGDRGIDARRLGRPEFLDARPGELSTRPRLGFDDFREPPESLFGRPSGSGVRVTVDACEPWGGRPIWTGVDRMPADPYAIPREAPQRRTVDCP